MANAYYGAGAKLAHPCYQIGKGYVCPECDECFRTEAPMEWHYLREHNPTEIESYNVVRWDRSMKHFRPEEWKVGEQKRKDAARFKNAARKAGWVYSGILDGYYNKDHGFKPEDEVRKIINLKTTI